MVTDGKYTYGSELFIMYRIVKSLCFTPKTNIISYVNYTPLKKYIGCEAHFFSQRNLNMS